MAAADRVEIVRELIALFDGFDFVGHTNSVTRDRYAHMGMIFNAAEAELRIDPGGDVRGLTQCVAFFDSVIAHCAAAAPGGAVALIQSYNHVAPAAPPEVVTLLADAADTCVCGGKVVVVPRDSEIVCTVCGLVEKLHGTISYDDTCASGGRAKHGSYDPLRHCKFWINRILANESAEIDEGCVEKIVECIRRDEITNPRKLRCYHVRGYLKEIKRTEYNDHVPLIRKIITNITPPQLTPHELRILYALFGEVTMAFEVVKPPTKSNAMYYPYIIYKIIDQILPPGRRKQYILECVHLQSRDTLIANDLVWRNICAIVPGIVYRPTNRTTQFIE